MHNFSFGGKNLLQFGGRILQAPSHVIAKRNTQRVKIYGKSGDVIIDNESYDNVDFSLKICFMPYLTGKTAHDLAYAIIDWLAPLQNDYYEYRDTYNSGFFTQAVLTNFDELVRELPTLLTATLKFSRVPFWYSDEGAIGVTFSNQAILMNPEKHSSEPIINLTYTGDIPQFQLRIEINRNPIEITAGANFPEQIIDGVRKQHYYVKDNVKNYISSVVPPDLVPGENLITLSTSNATCTVIPNWRRL